MDDLHKDNGANPAAERWSDMESEARPEQEAELQEQVVGSEVESEQDLAPEKEQVSGRLDVDLKSDEFTEKFREKGEIWRQSKTVSAVHVTEEGLEAGDYSDLGVHYGTHTIKDKESGREEPYTGWLIDTYVMKGEGDKRHSEYETTRPLHPGEWIVTNPKLLESDVDNNYAMPDDEFQKTYHATEQDGVYKSSGKLVRMFQNDLGVSVEFDSPWGGREEGDEHCYFATPYDPEKPEEIPEKRYAISANDVALTYKKLEQETQE